MHSVKTICGRKLRKTIQVNSPEIGREEADAVMRVLQSNVLTTGLGNGPMVKEFEKGFSKFTKTKFAIAVNSGTAALHSALLALDVGCGDEVVLPSFTFVATAEAVLLTGAKPVFIDIDPNTYNLNPTKIETALTPKTKAIIPVDLYGLPAYVDEVRKIASKHDVRVIEDAAQAHGAIYNGRPVGYFADVACWSFYASKNLTTGEGGMLTTNDEEIAEKLRYIRSHGEKEKYASSMLGHNYRMPEIEAAIGSVQLEKLPNFLEKRRENAAALTKELQGNAQVKLPTEPSGCLHSWYLYTVRLKHVDSAIRDLCAAKLRSLGVGVGVYYRNPIHLMPYYRGFGILKLPETERASQQVLSLPVHPGVNKEEITHIANSMLECLNEVY